jgi:cytochrome c553
MLRLNLLILAVLVPIGAVAQSPPAGDAVAGAQKAAMCAGCHPLPGYRNAYPPYRVPKLGGQHAAYIVAALEAYRTGERQHPTMRAVAAGLSAQDRADLAAYFSSASREQ